jgi:hypothetical protein
MFYLSTFSANFDENSASDFGFHCALLVLFVCLIVCMYSNTVTSRAVSEYRVMGDDRNEQWHSETLLQTNIRDVLTLGLRLSAAKLSEPTLVAFLELRPTNTGITNSLGNINTLCKYVLSSPLR